MINKLVFINKIVMKLEKGLVVLSFSLMALFSFLNVVLRALYTKFDYQSAGRILNHIDWSDPVARLMVLWVTFLGASLLTEDNKHVRIDFMGHLLPDFFLSLRELILSLAGAVICFFMVRASIGYLNMEMQYGTSSIMGISAWKWQLIIPMGFGLMLFRFTLNFLKELMKLPGKKVR